jgi:hypothetical protein
VRWLALVQDLLRARIAGMPKLAANIQPVVNMAEA